MMFSRRKILIISAVAAAAVRIFFAYSVYGSGFDNYHIVTGLDMQTLLRFSEWGSGVRDSEPFFTFHRLLIFLIWYINGKTHCIWAIFAIQSLVGIAGSVCIADLVLKFTAKRKTALLCGIASAAYLTFPVYEFSVLQETFMTNFTLFAFWSMLNALHKRFDAKSAALFAIFSFAASTGRPVAVLFIAAMWAFVFFKMSVRKKLAKTVFPLLLMLFMFASATLFNAVYSSCPSPFYNVLSYTLHYNQQTPEASGDVANAPDAGHSGFFRKVFHSGMNAAGRVPTLFKHGELPENQNIYFWCEKLPLLHLLIAPGLLIPCAAAGIMILIFSGGYKNRYALLLLPLVTLALPLCAREAIGRYRLMLIPYFFVICASAWALFFKIKDPTCRGINIFAAGCGAFFSVYNGEAPEKIRLSDYCTHAIATADSDAETALADHRAFWDKSRHGSEQAFRMYAGKALQLKEHALVEKITAEAARSGINVNIIRYFRAWNFAMQNDPQQARFELENITSLPKDMHANAIMLYKDTMRILNNSNN